jgi:hypothetical protein
VKQAREWLDSQSDNRLQRDGWATAYGLRQRVKWSNLARMTKLEEIEDAVRQLSRRDLASFRAWFAHLDAAAWDRQMRREAHRVESCEAGLGVTRTSA